VTLYAEGHHGGGQRPHALAAVYLSGALGGGIQGAHGATYIAFIHRGHLGRYETLSNYRRRYSSE